MFKTIKKLGAAALIALGVGTAQAQTYIPLTTFGGQGSALNQLFGPYDVSLAPDGKIFVADQNNDRISVWTQSGNTFGNLTTFGSQGSALNQLKLPGGISIAPDGKIFVADINNDRISVWTQSGNTFGNHTTFGGFGLQSNINKLNDPSSVTIAPDGKIFVADQTNQRISVWTQSGNTFGNLTTFGGFGSALDQFQYPSSVSIASDGKIFVADFYNGRISVWTQSGNTFGNLTTFGSIGNALNQFYGPSDVTIAPDGKIFVVDQTNQRISVWTQSGNTFGNLTTFGGYGSALNQFTYPYGVTVSPDGKIFVADQNNSRISVWELQKQPQTISGFTIPTSIAYGSTISGLNATATSGLSVTYSSSSSLASIVGNNILTYGVGVVTITALQVGNGDYFEATPIDAVLTITQANLTIIGTPLTRTYGAANPTFTNTGIGFKNSDDINGGVIINYGGVPANANVGVYEYAVVLSGDNVSNYNVTTVAGSLSITQAPLTIIGATFTRTYGNNINVSLLNSSIVGTIFFGDGITISTLTNFDSRADVGTYPVNVEPQGAKVVNYAITTVAGVQTIEKANQNILNFGPLNDITFAGINTASPTITATTSSGLIVAFSISGAAFISNGAISITGAGLITVIASQAGNNNYLPALSLTRTFNVLTIPGLGTSISANSLLSTLHSSFVIYPNPTSNGELRIENGELGATMYIFNAQGVIVYSQTITSTSTEVNTKLSKGIYLVKVGNYTTKLVVE